MKRRQERRGIKRSRARRVATHDNDETAPRSNDFGRYYVGRND